MNPLRFLAGSGRLSLFCLISLGGIRALFAAEKAEVVYSTDFESFSKNQQFMADGIDGWTGNGNGGSLTVTVTDEESHGGKHSLVEIDQDPDATPLAWCRLSRPLTNAKVSVSVKVAAAQTSFRFDFNDAAGTNFMVIHGFKPELGEVGFYLQKGESFVKGVPDSTSGYSATNWNALCCQFDQATHGFSLTLNGKVILALEKEEGKDISWNTDRIGIATGYWKGSDPSFKAYFDDFSVTTATP